MVKPFKGSSLTFLLSSKVKAEVFRLLFGVEPLRLHVRELARRADLAVATVRQELGRLATSDLVQSTVDGNRTYYKANQDHPLFPDIRNLVLKTTGLVDILRPALQDRRIRLAFVFGSMAAGSEKAASDIDLMIVGEITLRQAAPRLADVSGKLGREINPHVMTPAEFTRRRTRGDHFVTNVLASPRIFVMGNERELEDLGG